jgi:hypothetical protein
VSTPRAGLANWTAPTDKKPLRTAFLSLTLLSTCIYYWTGVNWSKKAMAGGRLGRGEFEFNPEQAQASRREVESLLTTRILFSLAVLLVNQEKGEALLKIGSEFSEAPSLPSTDLQGFETAIDKVLPMAEAWCKSISLEDPWCFRCAAVFACAARWNTDQTATPMFQEAPRLLAKTEAELRLFPEDPLVIDFGDWDILRLTRHEFLRKSEQLFKERLRAYWRQKESLALNAGLIRTRERRKLDPFLWLAGYQVNRWSKRQISEAIDNPRGSVSEQMDELAEEIGLTKRSPDEYDSGEMSETIKARIDAAFLELSRINPSTPAFLAIANNLPPAIMALLTSRHVEKKESA